MTVLAAACRVAVGTVLLLAGVAKLRQPAWEATAAQFGAPRPVVPAVPWAELVLGALLVSGAGGRWPVFGALAVLGAFTGVVAARLVSGQRAPCGCFGEASPAPLGPATLVRDVALVAACLVGLTGTRAPAPGVVIGVVAGAVFVVLARRH